MEADISENPKRSTNLKRRHLCVSKHVVLHRRTTLLAGAKGTQSGVAKPAFRKAPCWKEPPTPVSAEKSHGNNPDHSGKLNFPERQPDNGKGKKRLLGPERLTQLHPSPGAALRP